MLLLSALEQPDAASYTRTVCLSNSGTRWAGGSYLVRIFGEVWTGSKEIVAAQRGRIFPVALKQSSV